MLTEQRFPTPNIATKEANCCKRLPTSLQKKKAKEKDQMFFQGPNLLALRFNTDNFITYYFYRLKEYKIFQNVTFPVFIYVPTFGVVLVCIYIIVIVKIREKTKLTSQEKKKKKEKQAVLQLVLIIVAFLIGYIPFTGKKNHLFQF